MEKKSSPLNIKLIVIFFLVSSIAFFPLINEIAKEAKETQDIESYSQLMYLEEDNSTILYGDKDKNLLTVVDWSFYKHQAEAKEAFKGIIYDPKCPMLGITKKRIRDFRDFEDLIRNEYHQTFIIEKKCRGGQNKETNHDFLSFIAPNAISKISEFHRENTEFSIVLLSEKWWWSGRFNKEINSSVAYGLLEKNPKSFCSLWVELLFIPEDSRYRTPLYDLHSHGKSMCIKTKKKPI